MKTAIVIGSTGLTGGYLLAELAANPTYSKIIVLVRKASQQNNPKIEELVVDFNKLSDFKNKIIGDDVYCTIGTTIKKAGSQEAFSKVDLEYPLSIAKVAKENGAKHFLLMSSLGANAASGNFYLKTKGTLENNLRDLNFDSLSIFRPSILLGPRSEFRLGEKIGIFFMRLFSFLLLGSLKKYRPIHVKQVAHAMVKAGQDGEKGVRVWESDGIRGFN
ncbi:MAG: oxidoreductase [Bacteroidetes bacterium]|nr:oxidoreductase [Bacteroidota bacterium]